MCGRTRGRYAKHTGVLLLTHTRQLALAPIGCPVAGTRVFCYILKTWGLPQLAELSETQRHGWCSVLLNVAIRFRVTVYVMSRKSRYHAICRSELGCKRGLRHPPSLERAMYETDRKSCTMLYCFVLWNPYF